MRSARAHRVGDVAQDRVADAVAVVVVDRLEVVEVGQYHADRLVGERGLLGDLGEARLQRATVEQASELVERAVGAMADVGGDERAHVDRGADDERQRDHERLRMTDDVGGIDAERRREHEHGAHGAPTSSPRLLKRAATMSTGMASRFGARLRGPPLTTAPKASTS